VSDVEGKGSVMYRWKSHRSTDGHKEGRDGEWERGGGGETSTSELNAGNKKKCLSAYFTLIEKACYMVLHEEVNPP
jgi:hypothetical protein